MLALWQWDLGGNRRFRFSATSHGGSTRRGPERHQQSYSVGPLEWLLCETNLGTRNFLCLYFAHVTLLTQAQGRLSLCSGFAQACSPLFRLSTIFGTLRHSMLNCFNSSRVGLELVSEITRQDPRKKLGIQFILVTTDPMVVKTFIGFNNEHSLLCHAKIYGGALNKPLNKC
jgi:hypothetical protein